MNSVKIPIWALAIVSMLVFISLGYFIRDWSGGLLSNPADSNNAIQNDLSNESAQPSDEVSKGSSLQDRQSSSSRELDDAVVDLRTESIINDCNKVEEIYAGIQPAYKPLFLTEGHIGKEMMDSILGKINKLKADYHSYDFSTLDRLYGLTLAHISS